MHHVLVVEDEKSLREIIQDYFISHEFDCDTAQDGQDALECLRIKQYDAILLDIMMPRLDGFQVCKEIRRKSNIPILFLTALGEEEDMLQGYALGADDYVTKPFLLSVLVAKTQAIIRRNSHESEEEQITCGRISLIPAQQKCYVQGQEKHLTTGEFQLLLYLVCNKGQVLSRAQLLDRIWGYDYEGDDRAVDVRIRTLRAALGDAGKQIKTIYKAGYRLEETI